MFCILFVLIIFVSIIFVINSFNTIALDKQFYKKEFEKYDIYEKFPGEDIDKINSILLEYLYGIRKDYDYTLFDKKEREHLSDVRSVIVKLNILKNILFIIIIPLVSIIYFLDRTNFLLRVYKIFFYSGFFTLVISSVMILAIFVGFDILFTIFHKLFFAPGTWVFDYSENIIKIYPLGFFYDISKEIFIRIIYNANILIATGILMFSKK